MTSEMNQRSSMIARIILIAVGIVLPLLMAEVGLRVYFYVKGKDIDIYRPSFVKSSLGARDNASDRRRYISVPFLPYAPRPNDSRTFNVWRDAIKQSISYTYANNSWGFRSPEIPVTKPARTKRIITVGGSTTWDGLTNDLTWPSLLQKKLQEHYKSTGESIEVVNMGVEAYASPMSFVWLSFMGLQFSPDLVISYDGINDSGLIGRKGLTPDYRSIMRHFDNDLALQARLPAWAFRSYFITTATYTIDRYGWFGYSDVWSAIHTTQLPPAEDPASGIEYFERNLRLMRGVSNEYGARFLAATAHWTHNTPSTVLQNQKMRQFFQQTGIPYVDLDAELPHDDWSLHVDHAHWTTKGLELVAEAFAEKIVSDDLLQQNESVSNQQPGPYQHSVQGKKTAGQRQPPHREEIASTITLKNRRTALTSRLRIEGPQK
jgi:hypothetical protein